jgi:dihydrofolate synthase/folylpolyglutamate synthase
MTSATLDDWLEYIERVHPRDIEMGLQRVTVVAERMGLLVPARRTVIVAGTNGKGSTCVATEAVLRQLGWRVGTTLSPHVSHFSERVRIDAEPCSDEVLCAGFAAVEAARGDIPLTYFEFSALLALHCFKAAAVDVAILEVGLGGRLDAFNVVSADVAVVTSIGLDHMEYLGADEEQIGAEKAGVMRPHQQVVLGPQVSHSVLARAAELHCSVHQCGQTFFVDPDSDGAHWGYRSSLVNFPGVAPNMSLASVNCAMGIHAALLVHASLGNAPAVTQEVVAKALAQASLPGRMEQISAGGRDFLLDVAHNPAGARFLAAELARRYPKRQLTAVFGSLRDKDTGGVVAGLAERIDQWIGVDVPGPRGLSAVELAQRMPPGVVCTAAGGIDSALQRARSETSPGDVILVCGSFTLVDAARSHLQQWLAA